MLLLSLPTFSPRHCKFRYVLLWLSFIFLWGGFSTPGSLFPNKTLSLSEMLIHFLLHKLFTVKCVGKAVEHQRGLSYAAEFRAIDPCASVKGEISGVVVWKWSLEHFLFKISLALCGLWYRHRWENSGSSGCYKMCAVFILWEMGSPQGFRGRQW